jgi:hypothetical protein
MGCCFSSPVPSGPPRNNIALTPQATQPAHPTAGTTTYAPRRQDPAAPASRPPRVSITPAASTQAGRVALPQRPRTASVDASGAQAFPASADIQSMRHASRRRRAESVGPAAHTNPGRPDTESQGGTASTSPRRNCAITMNPAGPGSAVARGANDGRQPALHVMPHPLQMPASQQAQVTWSKREARYGVSGDRVLTTRGVSPCIAGAIGTVPPRVAALMHIHPTATDATIREQTRAMLQQAGNGSPRVAYVRGGYGGHPRSERAADVLVSTLQEGGVHVQANETLASYQPAEGTGLAIDPATNAVYRDIRDS